MRLSRLHIAGFKSFPDRSELGFDNGVTAIVGPNGCGKSNVVDAITWVLGEQSAKSLRGERMEDVIFNGSDIRKPTAAAEVRLKFTQVAQAMPVSLPVETSADELLDDQPLVTRDVEIGRRLYRSGESEYLIDGEVCRLRDVHDLLMDSGLGVKAYAVIEQGKIGQILASRPAERRMLIEEAAGVTKYKSRRRAAELKLEAAQQNLTRIDDIVFEVEKQRGALKRQAARARRYKRLREELRTWEQVQFARRYDVLRAEIDATSVRLDEARGREVAAAAHLSEVENALETWRMTFAAAEAESIAVREQAHASELAIGRLQQQMAFDRQQIEDISHQSEIVSAEVVDLDARQEPAARAIELQRDAAARARETLAAAAVQVAEREAAYAQSVAAVQAVDAEADGARQLLLSASTALSALHQARDHAAAVRDRIAVERERLEMEARDLAAEAQRMDAAHQSAVAALGDERAAHDVVRGRRVQVETELLQRRAARAQAAAALGASERELAGVEARLRSLEELETQRARFGDAARFLLASGEAGIRVHGAVADQLEVESSFERAVEALAGDILQYVLVDTADAATAALAAVASRRAGRCGLVVLDDAGRAANPQSRADASLDAARAHAPAARTLASVVRATGEYADVVRRLLPDALVVSSFDEARLASLDVPVPVATLGGDVLRGGWLVHGGSHGDDQGILEIRAEVKRLRDEVNQRRQAVQGHRHDVAGFERAIEADEQQLAQLVADQHAHEKAIVGVDAQVTRTVDECARVARRLELVASERARADEEMSATDRRRDEAVAAMVEREGQQRAAEEQLGRVLSAQQAARAASEAAMRLLADSRTEQAALTERLAGLDLEVTRLEVAQRELTARLDARRQDRARLDARREELRRELVELERTLDETVAALEVLKQTLRQTDERVTTLRQDLLVAEGRIRMARQALDGARGQVAELEVGRATATADLTHLASTCLESVGLPLEEVAERVARLLADGALVPPVFKVSDPAEDEEDESGTLADPVVEIEGPSAAESAVAQPAESGAIDPEPVILTLRGKIDRLGPVNMMAIEQFDELESRHAFLTAQRKDLLDSIAQTGEAIKKIEKTTRDRFTEAFHSINAHFEQTFTTLFGGGRAGLVLIDNDNDPETGIDIIAQPPGKRLQNVQLLSGGEKALTAMALMFAIFKHRPSPFCLLDEIDAPLDDANIGRFVEMLQGMQAHTQFILITHNRKTMEIADRLYGVTMEEPGVSKLISLQLN